MLNPSSKGQILDLSKWKAFADDKIYSSKTEVFYEMNRKHCGKRRKCQLPTLSPSPMMFSKASFSRSLKVGIVW